MDQPYARRERARQLDGQLGPIAGHLGDQPGQRGVRRVVTEQVGSDPIRDPEAAGQQRALEVLDQHQPVPEQRPARLQPAPGGGREPGYAGQLQRQSDRRASPGDIVVEIAVQPLEP